MLSMLERFDEGIAAATDALPMSGRHPWLLAELAAMLSARGETDAAETIHPKWARAQTGYVGWAERAAAAASAGHLDLARARGRRRSICTTCLRGCWKIGAWRPARRFRM